VAVSLWRMPPEGTALRSLRRRNLREEAVEVLRAAILGGELEPGSIHSAVSLAEHLGVSPTPVREAMLELSRSGLVEVLPNRGFRVTVVDDRDLDEIYELRRMLEVPAMKLVIDRASAEQLDALEQPLTALEAAADKNDVPAFLVADREFHLATPAVVGQSTARHHHRRPARSDPHHRLALTSRDRSPAGDRQ
jgi:DNA-binding GntR family transcriptional regulator